MDPIPAIPTRKVRGDCKLERLAPDQHDRLRRWLERENRTYTEIVQLIHTDFGLSVGKSAVAAYWRRHILPHRYQEVAEDALEIADVPETKFSEAALNLVRMHAYIALASSEPDLKTATRLLETVRSADRLALARERFEFDQRRAAAKEKLAEEKLAAEAAAKEPEFDYDFANRPMPRASDGVLVGGWPPASESPPLFEGPALFPGYSALDRPKSPEISSPSPSTPPSSIRKA